MSVSHRGRGQFTGGQVGSEWHEPVFLLGYLLGDPTCWVDRFFPEPIILYEALIIYTVKLLSSLS